MRHYFSGCSVSFPVVSVCVSVHVCACMFLCMCVCMHKCVHVCVHARVCVCVHMCVYMCVCSQLCLSDKESLLKSFVTRAVDKTKSSSRYTVYCSRNLHHSLHLH